MIASSSRHPAARNRNSISIGVTVYEAKIHALVGIGKIQVLDMKEVMKQDANSKSGKYSHASSFLFPLLKK